MKKTILTFAISLFFVTFINAQKNGQGYYAHDGSYGKVIAKKSNLIVREFPMEDSKALIILKKEQNVSFSGRHKINKSRKKNRKWYKVYFSTCNGKIINYDDYRYKGCNGKKKDFDGWVYSENASIASY